MACSDFHYVMLAEETENWHKVTQHTSPKDNDSHKTHHENKSV